jgi:hypothetical protein
MARALHCPIFKHQPPSHTECALAQLFMDLSTTLATGLGVNPPYDFAMMKKQIQKAQHKTARLSNHRPLCTEKVFKPITINIHTKL